ncbi:hypothetical protein [uncultured Jatrophihabitans sp.]|uniref:hypothetical protein n=1 Tax=uncultured Jatrophihabitans sp. TaxID=1610747 RepID=UPI0035CC9D3E
MVGGLLLVLSAPAIARPQVLYRFADPRIDEASGIAVGLRSPGVDYVQNDSGDTARFFAIDAATGRTAATVTVPGATNVDWEDIAVAPDAAGRSSVWLADIGDNDAVRSEVRIYRVDEPRIAPNARDRRVRSTRPDVWRLRYPDGAVNAESFAVTPTGTGYLITKSLLGSSVVYRLPPRPDAAHVQTLVRVGAITFGARQSDTRFGAIGTLTATGAALSRDGSVLAVRTYADAFLWPVRGNDVAAALRRAPTWVALPVEPQGEGIVIDGSRLLVDSEGVGTAVYAVPLPRLPAPSTPSTPSTSVVPSTPVTSPQRSSAPRAARHDSASSTSWLLVGTLGGAVLVAAAVTWRWRRAR